MKEIQLTQGQFSRVDDKDFERINKYKWYARKHHTGKYVAARSIRDKLTGKVTGVLLHRFIINAPDGVKVDHIDLDTLNNQRSNFRLCNNSQNKANCTAYKTNKSGYKGVYKRGLKWAAQVRVKGSLIHIGVFDTKEQAALAYNEGAKKHHGEFARLNRIEAL
jgi:hypothetical protein